MLPERLEEMVECIDGNKSYYPIAWCKSKKGWLTIGLETIHKCRKRQCVHYEERQVEE